MSERTLTVQDVIELVKSIPVSVSQIESDLQIPASVLARALPLTTKKPLPVKYELRLLEYVKIKRLQADAKEKITVEVLRELGVDIPEKKIHLAEDEVENKKWWLKKIKEARSITHSAI